MPSTLSSSFIVSSKAINKDKPTPHTTYRLQAPSNFDSVHFKLLPIQSAWLLALLAAVCVQIWITVLAPCHWPAALVSVDLGSAGSSWAVCHNIHSQLCTFRAL